MPMYLVMVALSIRVLMDRSDPLYAAAGGVCLALVLALLVGAMGSQTFYPREGSVGMWAAVGILFRVYVERNRARALGVDVFEDEEEEPGDADWEDSAQPA